MKFVSPVAWAAALTSIRSKPPLAQMYTGGQWCDPENGNYRSVQSPHSGRGCRRD